MKFEVSFKVGPSHLASNGLLSVRSMIDMMQDCSIFQLDSEPQLANYFKETNSGMFLSQRQIEIKRLPHHGEQIKAMTWVYKCNAMFGFRNTNLYDEAGNVCVCSSAVGVFVDYATGQMIRIPADVLDTVPRYEPFDMEYLPRKIAVPPEIDQYACSDPIYVWHYMIDANKHVNNARYVSVAQEFIPEDFAFNHIRVEFLLAAKQGEFLYPKTLCLDNGYLVLLDNADGAHYAVVEFTKA